MLQEDAVNQLLGLSLVGLLFQPGKVQRLRVDSLPRSCVATERMPIVGLYGRPPEPMPVFRSDSTWRSRMPVAKLVPCYLAP